MRLVCKGKYVSNREVASSKVPRENENPKGQVVKMGIDKDGLVCYVVL